MNVHDFLYQISLGELTDLAVSDDGTDDRFSDENRQRIIFQMDKGLALLSRRFRLLERTIYVQTFPGQVDYLLRPAFVAEPHAPLDHESYIYPSYDYPFLGDLVKVFEVRNEFGKSLALNQEEDCHSVYTPRHDVLRVPLHLLGQRLGVQYQATHPRLADCEAPECADLMLPVGMEEMLMLYVAAKIYGGMNTETAIVKAKDLMAQFDGRCLEMMSYDSDAASTTRTNLKAVNRGFV